MPPLRNVLEGWFIGLGLYFGIVCFFVPGLSMGVAFAAYLTPLVILLLLTGAQRLLVRVRR